ncbi:PTS sugar transporter [Salmonella enterica]
MKKIAIIGSSGGNLYNLGGAEPEKLLQEIYQQCEAAGVNVAAVQFIAAEASMDVAKPDTPASVYALTTENQQKPQRIFQGKLSEVNTSVVESDRQIAEMIRRGEIDGIDGIVVMSADPVKANQAVFAAAVEMKTPIVGTEGTSMALVATKGANVVATSGTTGTTSRTRAVSFVASLCKHWGIKYKPQLGSASPSQSGSGKSLLKRFNIRSIMIPALPGFIAMAIVLALSHIPGLEKLNDIFEILLKGLPVLVAVLAAKQISELDEVSIVAGVVAGVLSVEGGLIGGIIGGVMAGIFVRWLFELCLNWRFPMTTVNIVAGGISGLAAGLIMHYLLSPLALSAGNYIKLAIESTLAFSPILAGLLAGLVIWPAILGGVYHAVILPLVLLEMEKSGVSFLGAVDMVGLVMVAAGINLANVIAPREKSEAAVATPGLLINLGFGTFVESAYPFMFANKIVFGSAIFWAGMGGMMLGFFNVKGVAYVPAFASPFLSNNALQMAIVMIATMAMTCLTTIIANRFKPVVQSESTTTAVN